MMRERTFVGWSGVLPVQVPAMDWNLEGCKLQIDDMQRVRVSVGKVLVQG